MKIICIFLRGKPCGITLERVVLLFDTTNQNVPQLHTLNVVHNGKGGEITDVGPHSMVAVFCMSWYENR